MIADNLPDITSGEIERRAARLLEAVPSSKRRNIEFIAEQYCDAEIESVHGLCHFGVLGATCRNQGGIGKRYRILVDQMVIDQVSRSHYTEVLCEEIGHIQLHEAIVNAVRTTEEYVEIHSRKDWLVLERQAKRFGRAISLPVRLVELQCQAGYRQFVDDFGFGRGGAILPYLAAVLSVAFSVSQDEAKTRIAECDGGLVPRVQGSYSLGFEVMLPLQDLMVASRQVQTQLEFPEFQEIK